MVLAFRNLSRRKSPMARTMTPPTMYLLPVIKPISHRRLAPKYHATRTQAGTLMSAAQPSARKKTRNGILAVPAIR